jgi:hypothetical protein
VAVEVRPIRLASPTDSEGALILRDDALIAVLSKLGPEHGALEGQWYVEAVFAAMTVGADQQFPDIGTACRYFETLET